MHAPNGILGNSLPSLKTEYWINPDGVAHKIGQWPRPNSLRAQTKYRNFEGQHDFPIATRYLIHLTAVDDFPPFPFPDLDIWAWLDAVDGSSNDFEGSTQLAPFVPRCEFHIRHTETLPTLGVPGVEVLATWFNLSGSFFTSFEWSDQGGQRFDPLINTVDKPPDNRTEGAPGFGYNSRNCEVYAVSECYDFPTEPSLIIGEAAFNGLDAYIQLDHNLTMDSGPHSFSADLRLRGSGKQTIFGRNDNPFIFGIDDDDGKWITVSFLNLNLPAAGTWFNYRQEFEWSDPSVLKYRIFIDDVLEKSLVSTRWNTFFHVLGVANRLGPAVFGDFDMRFLKVLKGTPAAPVVILDMPLQENALDLSPDANHGTTFNMPLPST